MASTDNYVIELGHDENYPFVNMAISVRTDIASMYSDKYQQYTGDWTTVYGGSTVNALGVAGINYWDYYSGSSQSSNRLGARLIKKAY